MLRWSPTVIGVNPVFLPGSARGTFVGALKTVSNCSLTAGLAVWRPRLSESGILNCTVGWGARECAVLLSPHKLPGSST